MSAPELFTPVRLGAIDLKNRIVMAPLTRSRANPMGIPADFAAEYYSRRAAAGLLITEATQITFQGMGYPRTPGIHNPDQIKAWRKITNAVHDGGGKIFLQLMHVGRVANHLNRGVVADVVAPSAIRAPGEIWTDAKGLQPYDMPRALETDEVPAIAQDYATAAVNALSAGFDGVEFHAANGYLPQQFLSTNVNRRTDRYGGSIENRVRMPVEVVEAILAKVPAGKVGIRLSPGNIFNSVEETDMPELYANLLGKLEAYNLAYVHIMRTTLVKLDVDPVTMARGLYNGAIIAAAGYEPHTAAALIGAGGAEAVAFGKAFIANPDLVERIKRGAPLNAPDTATFYTPGEKGYTDYPRLAA